MDEYIIKSLRIEYNSLRGLEDGIVLQDSAFGSTLLINVAIENDIPIFVVNDKGEIIYRLVKSDNQLKLSCIL